MLKSTLGWCIVVDLLNVVSSPDKVLILLDILSGIFGWWLERMLMYNGLLSGLL